MTTLTRAGATRTLAVADRPVATAVTPLAHHAGAPYDRTAPAKAGAR